LSSLFLAGNQPVVVDFDQVPERLSQIFGCVVRVSSTERRLLLPCRPPHNLTGRLEGVAMHKVSIPQSVIDRVVARRGREHIFDDLDPAKTALVVVDMQNGFMLHEVAHAPCAMAHEIVPNINRLAEAVRAAGGAVVWIQTAFTDETLTSWSTLYGMVGQKGAEKRRRSLSRDSKGYDLFPDLKVEPRDLIVEKKRYSAFIQGSSDLEAILRQRGLDTLLVTGTVTNVCCESTARDAMMLNFKTVMITDGNAANTDEDHNAALGNFYLTFGDIMSTDFAIECLKRNTRTGLVAAE
jgi:ureidoacrylate peracid hydrolase